MGSGSFVPPGTHIGWDGRPVGSGTPARRSRVIEFLPVLVDQADIGLAGFEICVANIERNFVVRVERLPQR